MDINLALMTGADIPIPECQLIMHQPTLKEIGIIGEQDFFLALQTLALDKTTLLNFGVKQEQIDSISNFQFLMEILQQDSSKVQLLNTLFTILFPLYKVSIIIPRSIIFKQNDEIFSLHEDNFTFFQDIISIVFQLQKKNNSDFAPINDAAQEIARKLQRARERVAAQKGETQKMTLGQYVSIITVGIPSMSLFDVIDLTLYQLYSLLERYSLYINWDLEIKGRLAGSTSEEKIESWMKPLV